MARKHTKNQGSAITNPRSLAKLHSDPLVSPSNRNLIRTLEDRREYHPEGLHRPPRALPKAATILTPSPNVNRTRSKATARTLGAPLNLSFSMPKQVSLCVRRHTRKEVLFALKRTGKGAHSIKRRNKWSDIKC